MTLATQLAALEESGLLVTVLAPPELEYLFRHALIQDAAYTSLLKNTRRGLHLSVGETLVRLYPDRVDELAPVLAYHYAEGGDDRQSRRFYTRAAEIASQKFANREAVNLYSLSIEAALRLGEPTAELRHARGHGHELLGAFDAARADYEAALDESCAHSRQAAEWQSLMDLGFLWAARDYARTGVYLERAYALASVMGDASIIARSLNRLGNWYMNVGRGQEALRAHERALAIVQSLDDVPGTAETCDLIGIASFQVGDAVRSLSSYAQAIELFRALGARESLVSALSVRSIIGCVALDQATVPGRVTLAACKQVGLEALVLAREIGSRVGESFALLSLGETHEAAGDFGPAYAALNEALAIATDIGHQQWMSTTNWGLALLYYDLNAPEPAVRHATLGYDLARTTGTTVFEFETSGLLALLAVEAGDLARAEFWLACAPGGSIGAAADDASSMYTHSQSLATQLAGARVVQMARIELALARRQDELALKLSDEMFATTAHIEEYGHGAVPRLARLRGEALNNLHRYAEAESELLAALSGARALGARPVERRICRSLALLYQSWQRPTERDDALAAAGALSTSMSSALTGELAAIANLAPNDDSRQDAL